MAGNPEYQDLNPAAAPSPVTPAASPGDAAGWSEVTPHGAGPAPYDISAPQDIAGIAAAVDAAGRLTGAGVVYPAGPRQSEAAGILDTPQGADSASVFSGFPDYENTDVSPGADLQTPIQGMGFHPGTTQEGLPMFDDGLGAGVEGVPPECGSMGTPGGNYPGTTQDGLQTYGT